MSKNWQSMTKLELLESRLEAWRNQKPNKLFSQDLIDSAIKGLETKIDDLKKPLAIDDE